ncbi:MAG: MFS transporter [Alphaproteobacteria bacterium]|nr:MFS transporter [Alphaproteobacteria bacterium]
MIGRCKHGNIKVIFGSHIVVQMVLIALIALLGARAANWVMILGMLYGVQHALYSMGQQQIIVDKIAAKRMMFFCGTDTAVTNIVKILVPVILGTLITISSLQNIAWVMVIMGAIELYLLFMIPPIQNRSKNRAELGGFIRQSLKIPCIRKLFNAEFLRGLAYELETVGILYIVYVFHTDMNLGIWTTIFAILTATVIWCFGRFCSKRDFGWGIGVCSALLTIAIICLMFDVNRFSVLMYSGSLALGVAMMDQACSVNVFNLAKTKLITKRYRAEYLATRQIVSFIGRWGGIIALLYVGVFFGYEILPYMMIFLVAARILAAFIYAEIGKYTDDK